MIEFAEQPAMLRLVGMKRPDALGGQPVEDPEFTLAEPLVDQRTPRAVGDSGLATDRVRRLAGPDIGGGDDDLGPLLLRHCGEPVADRLRLAKAELAQRKVDVADLEPDRVGAGGHRGGSSDIAGALAVPNDPQSGGPSLSHGRNKAPEAGKFRAAPRPRAGREAPVRW